MDALHDGRQAGETQALDAAASADTAWPRMHVRPSTQQPCRRKVARSGPLRRPCFGELVRGPIVAAVLLDHDRDDTVRFGGGGGHS